MPSLLDPIPAVRDRGAIDRMLGRSVRNEAANPPIPNPSAWIASHGANAPSQMCGLAGYQVAFSKEQLQKLYTNKKTYQDRVKKSVEAMEKAGWSLPVYRDVILEDAAKLTF